MPDKSFKFLHAANLYLSHQLVGTGYLNDDAQKVVQQATNAAFQNLVEEAIAWEVDFVLLAGNSFDETDESLGARVELLAGLSLLHAANIPTFILPGQADPYDVWHRMAGLPNSVTIINPQSSDLFAIESGEGSKEKLIAHIGTVRSFQSQPSRNSFQIAMTATDEIDEQLKQQSLSGAVNYLAMGGNVRQTVESSTGTLHAPGGTQGIIATDIGERGCSLVEVNLLTDTNQKPSIEIEFLPVATVRWESPIVQTSRFANKEMLSKQMSQALEDVQPQPHEKLWLLQWTLDNSGTLSSLLQEEKKDQSLTGLLRHILSVPKEIQIHSTYQLRPDENSINQLTQQSPLAESFFQKIDERKEALPEQLQQLMASAGLQENNRTKELVSLIKNLNPDKIRGHAQQLGLDWFSSIVSSKSLEEE